MRTMPNPPLQVAPDVAPDWMSLGEDTWTRVEGGSLPAPVYVRIAQTIDGRGVIDGIVIGAAWPRPEITARSLRTIKVGDILASIFNGWDINDPPDYDDLEDQVTWGMMHEHYVRRAERIPSTSRAGSRTAPKSQLEEFAEVYQKQRERNAHRAMTATAKAFNVSRATANRWAKKCRELGLLPEVTEPPQK